MKANFTNKSWWVAALIRAIKTMAQTAVATIGAAAVLSDVDWCVVASASALAGILSILTSIAGLPEVAPKDVPDTFEEVDEEDEEEDEED